MRATDTSYGSSLCRRESCIADSCEHCSQFIKWGRNARLELKSSNSDAETTSVASRKAEFRSGESKEKFFCSTELSAVTRYNASFL